MEGLIQVYTGDGKGKTTAAFGLAIRAAGRGLKVAIVQFLKTDVTGELFSIEKIGEIKFIRVNTNSKFTWEMNDEELTALAAETKEGFNTARKLAQSNEYDLLIMDEFIHSIHKEYVEKEEVIRFLKNRPLGLEVVMTGRNAPDWLIEIADLVTEMKCIKHPMQEGVPARIGIES